MGNPIAGHTLFVKRHFEAINQKEEYRYYLYRNQTYVKQGTIDFWNEDKWRNWRYIITLRNSSLVLLATKVDYALTDSAKGSAFSFDHEDYPGIIQPLIRMSNQNQT